MPIELSKAEMAAYKKLTTKEQQRAFVEKIKAQRAKSTGAKAAAPVSEADKIRAMFSGRKINVRNIAEEAAQREDGGVTWHKLEAGEHRVRFLPPVQDTGRLATLVVQCWFDDPNSDDEKKRRAYYSPRCLDPTAYCPATAAYKLMINSPSEDFRKLADDMRPEKFYIANVLLWDVASRTWKNDVLYMSPALYRDIAKKQVALVDPEDVGADGTVDSLGICDPLKNRVIVIKRTGAGKTTRWEVGVQEKTFVCTLEQLNARVDLDDIAKPADEATLESLVCATTGVSSMDELTRVCAKAASPKPADKAAARAGKPASKPAVVDDDVVVDDDDVTMDDLLAAPNDDAVSNDDVVIDGEATDDIVVGGDDDPLNFGD